MATKGCFCATTVNAMSSGMQNIAVIEDSALQAWRLEGFAHGTCLLHLLVEGMNRPYQIMTLGVREKTMPTKLTDGQ